MAVQKQFKLEEEELSCPICFEEFNLHDKNRQPKLLLCLHTFCLACMETLQKYDGSLQCSICRHSHHVYRVGELMDNYVIFDYLRFKQEHEDEKLATQLREEYEASLKSLREQEERDAQLAREEEERNKLEEEKRKIEAQKKREEEVNKILFEIERQKLEAERLRLQEERLKKEQENLKKEEELIRRGEEEDRLRMEERLMFERNKSHGPRLTDDEIDSSSTSESPDTRSEDLTDTENENETEEEEVEEGDDEVEERREDEEESFQDLESDTDTDTDTESEDEEDSHTSLVDLDDYFDTDRGSSQTVSSDEDEMGTALSTTASLQPPRSSSSHTSTATPSTSPEPDLLSEEFSGVAQPPPQCPAQEPLTKLLPAVKCAERADGSIVILDTPSPPTRPARRLLNGHAISVVDLSTDESEADDLESLSSLDGEHHSLCAPNVSPQKLAVQPEGEENCKLQ